jgi:hypothetical protein
MVRQFDWRLLLQHRRTRGAVRQGRLKELYPTHDAYVRAVTNDVQRLVAERALTKEDGDALIAEAKGAAVPF